MAFFHFNILRKYTASILDLFNELEVQTKLSNNKFLYTKIPIQYANRERFDIYSQLSYNQIFTGNTQVLPRAILLFNGMQVDINRARNKFVKIYKKIIKDGDKPKKLNYQFNSVPYNFNYQVIMQCRGMNEASMIVEQICSFFNPSYCMRIQEIDLPDFGYTSLILTLNDTQIEQSEIDDLSTNIVTITFDLTLRGNIYPAIKDQETIQLVQLFLSANTQNNDNVSRTSSISEDAEQKFINYYKTIIKDIEYKDSILKCIVDSKCEKLIKFNYDWFVNDVLLDSHEQEVEYNIKDGDIIKVRAFTDIVDSDFFEKKIFDESKDQEKIIINDILYEDNFLECIFTDTSKDNIKYNFDWYINGKKINQTQRIIKYKSDVSFGVKVIVHTSDGRRGEFYTKIYLNHLKINEPINIYKNDNFEITEIE